MTMTFSSVDSLDFFLGSFRTSSSFGTRMGCSGELIRRSLMLSFLLGIAGGGISSKLLEDVSILKTLGYVLNSKYYHILSPAKVQDLEELACASFLPVLA